MLRRRMSDRAIFASDEDIREFIELRAAYAVAEQMRPDCLPLMRARRRGQAMLYYEIVAQILHPTEDCVIRRGPPRLYEIPDDNILTIRWVDLWEVNLPTPN